MSVLAAFAKSDSGKVYGRVCERWGVDPAPFRDDFMAYNLRAALMVALIPEEPPELDDSTGIITDLEAQMRAMGGG